MQSKRFSHHSANASRRLSSPEMEVEIEAQIFTPKHRNTVNTYTMNHIQAPRVKCGKVEIDQILENLEMTQEKTKCHH
jgi:hypothetical protein